MDNRKKEIRKLLVGAFTEGKDGLEAVTGLFNPFMLSTRRGTFSAYLFGITSIRYDIAYRGEEENVFCAFANSFAKVGRFADLATAPEVLCAVVMPLVRAPYAFTFETFKDGEGALTYYSARGIFSRIKGKYQLKKLLSDVEGVDRDTVGKKRSKRRSDKAPSKEENKKKSAKTE